MTEILPLLLEKLSLSPTDDADHSYGKHILSYLNALRPSIAQFIKDDSSPPAYMHPHTSNAWIHLWQRVDKLSCILSTPYLHPRLAQFYLSELFSIARFLTLQQSDTHQDTDLQHLKALVDGEIARVPEVVAGERTELDQLRMMALMMTMDRDRLCAIQLYVESMDKTKDGYGILAYLLIAELYARNVQASRYFGHALYTMVKSGDEDRLQSALKYFCALLETNMDDGGDVMHYELKEDEHCVLSNEINVDLSTDPNATHGLTAKLSVVRTFSGMYAFFNRVYGCTHLVGELVVLEEMPHHLSLKDFLHTHLNISFAERRDIVLVVASVLHFLHQLDMSFTDLDMESISLDSELMPLLALTNEFTHDVVEQPYFAELDDGLQLDAVERRKRQDVYAFGVIMWQILTAGMAFDGVEAALDIQLQHVHGWMDDSDELAGLYMHILKMCWNEQMDERPSMHELIDLLVDANSRNNSLYEADTEAWKRVMTHVQTYQHEPINQELQERVALYSIKYPDTQVFKADPVADVIYNRAILAYDTKDYPQASRYFAESSAYGHAGGDNGLGLCFYYGYSIKANQRIAFSYFLKASERNWPGAVRNVGISYESGEGVPLNYEKAFEYYHKGSYLKHAESIANLAACYYYGRGTSSFWRKAISYFEQASDLGSAYGTRMLATCYQDGNGVTANDVKAMLLFEKAIDLGDKFSVSMLCELLFKHHAYHKIERMCTHLSSRGNHDATVYLGQLRNKLGEHAVAEALYKDAAHTGNNGDAWYFYGCTQEAHGLAQVAKSCYLKALETSFTYFENDAHFGSASPHRPMVEHAMPAYARLKQPLNFEGESLRAFYQGTKTSYGTLLFLWESATLLNTNKWTCCHDKYPCRFNPVHAVKRLIPPDELLPIYDAHIVAMQRAIEDIFNSPEYHGIRSSTTTDAYKTYAEPSHVVVTISFHLFRTLLVHFISEETALSPASLMLFNAHLEHSTVSIPAESLIDVILDMTFDAHVPFSALFLEACIDYLERFEAQDKLAGLYIKFIHQMQVFRERAAPIYASLRDLSTYSAC